MLWQVGECNIMNWEGQNRGALEPELVPPVPGMEGIILKRIHSIYRIVARIYGSNGRYDVQGRR